MEKTSHHSGSRALHWPSIGLNTCNEPWKGAEVDVIIDIAQILKQYLNSKKDENESLEEKKQIKKKEVERTKKINKHETIILGYKKHGKPTKTKLDIVRR